MKIQKAQKRLAALDRLVVELHSMTTRLLRIISRARERIKSIRAKIPPIFEEGALVHGEKILMITLNKRGSIIEALEKAFGIQLGSEETSARVALRSLGVTLSENTVRLITEERTLLVEEGHTLDDQGGSHRVKNVFMTETDDFIPRTEGRCRHTDSGGVSVHLSFDTLCVTNLAGVYGEGTRIFLRQPTHQS